MVSDENPTSCPTIWAFFFLMWFTQFHKTLNPRVSLEIQTNKTQNSNVSLDLSLVGKFYSKNDINFVKSAEKRRKYQISEQKKLRLKIAEIEGEMKMKKTKKNEIRNWMESREAPWLSVTRTEWTQIRTRQRK